MLIAHLAKEWREQRLLLAMCAAVLLVLPALAAWLLPDSGVARLPWFAIAVLVGAVVLGTELVGGEARRGQLDFLARLPGAMRQTMRAKLCVLAGGILVLAGIGYVAEGGSPDGYDTTDPKYWERKPLEDVAFYEWFNVKKGEQHCCPLDSAHFHGGVSSAGIAIPCSR